MDDIRDGVQKIRLGRQPLEIDLAMLLRDAAQIGQNTRNAFRLKGQAKQQRTVRIDAQDDARAAESLLRLFALHDDALLNQGADGAGHRRVVASDPACDFDAGQSVRLEEDVEHGLEVGALDVVQFKYFLFHDNYKIGDLLWKCKYNECKSKKITKTYHSSGELWRPAGGVASRLFAMSDKRLI